MLALALDVGVSEADVLGFYALRVVPQWLRQREIVRPSDPATAHLVEG